MLRIATRQLQSDVRRRLSAYLRSVEKAGTGTGTETPISEEGDHFCGVWTANRRLLS